MLRITENFLQKSDLLEELEEYRKNKRDMEKTLLELNKEINLSDEKLSGMEDAIIRLKAEIKELQSTGENYKQRSEVSYYKCYLFCLALKCVSFKLLLDTFLF